MVTIRDMRVNLGMSQETLAVKLGVRQNTVSNWETGARKPNIELLPKLADILGCTVDELLRDKKSSADTE